VEGKKAHELANILANITSSQGGMGNTNTMRIVKADVDHLGIGQR